MSRIYLITLIQQLFFIDEKTAAILPRVLCSSRVKCENSAMKYVIVRCEELGGEEAFLLENGEAYVPL